MNGALSRREWMATSAAGLGLAAVVRPGEASVATDSPEARPRHVGRPERISESIYRDPKAHVGWLSGRVS